MPASLLPQHLSRRTALTWLAAGLAARSLPAAASTPSCPIVPFEARYTMYTSVMSVGKGLIALEKDASGAYRMRSRIEPSGVVALFVKDQIVERVSGTVLDGVPMPARYSQAHTGGDLDHISGAEFDWAAGTAASHYNGKRKSLALAPRVVDPLSMYALLMSDLGAGKRPKRYRIANRARIKSYWLAYHGVEMLDAPIGRIRALKVTRKRKRSNKLTTLWFAADHGFLPAQILHEKNGQTEFRISLAQATRIGREVTPL